MSDAEYRRALEHASPPYLRIALELAYLLRARRGEVLALRWGDVRDDGVLVRRTKGSRETLVRWSERLRAVIDAARALPGASSVLVLHDGHGQPITVSAYNTARRRMMQRAGLAGWTGHDLKAKGASDLENATPRDTGHRTAKAAAVYDRKTWETDPTA